MDYKQDPDNEAMSRVCAEYTEMPGLRLTLGQAQRLHGLNQEKCIDIYGKLVESGFLMKISTGEFMRPSWRKGVI